MSRVRRLTAIDFDGVVMRGAVVRVLREGTVDFLRCAESTVASPEDALAEVVAALDGVPANCVVRTTEAVAGLVHLPIPAAGRRAPDEMAQLLRWELEPLFAQQVAAHTLGSILKARGHMDRTQVERVVALLAERRAASRDTAPVRFEVIARELGHVTEAQITEAVAIQERMTPTEDSPVCGWVAQGVAAVGGTAADGGAGSAWFVAGMSAGRRRWWSEQLRRHGLKLRAVYPRLGVASAGLPRGASAELLEVEPHAVAHTVVRDGVLVTLQIVPVSDAEPAAQICNELLADSGSEILVTGSVASPEFVAALGEQAKLLDSHSRGAAVHRLSGLGTVCRHATGHGGPAVAVPARDPAPPLRRRPAAWWCGGLVALALAFVVADTLLAASVRGAEQEFAAAKEPWESVDREIRDVGRDRSDAETILNEIETLRAERALLTRRRGELEKGIAARRGFLLAVLDSLAAAITEDILIERVAEEQHGRILVRGSALSERSVQVFTQRLAANTVSLRLRIIDTAIRAANAASGVGAYAFSFSLEPAPMEGSS